MLPKLDQRFINRSHLYMYVVEGEKIKKKTVMACSNWVIVIVEFSIIIHLAHADFHCENQGTYTQNSAYQRNLNDTLSNLTRTDNAGDGFFNASSNSPQDNAYALALCPGDFNPTNCLQCVKSASEQLPQDCPNEKKATGWYEGTCMLRYSNSSFDMNRNDVLLLLRKSYMSDWDSVVDPLRNLSEQLLGEAASDDYNTAYYSNGANLQRSSDYIAINVTMQCIPDISRKISCGECLVNAANDLVTCCRGTSEVVGLYRYSCFLRYTIIPAVNVPVTTLAPVPPTDPPTMRPLMPPPNPPSGGKGSHIIGPVIAAAAVTLAFSTLFIFQKVRKICSKKGQEEELLDISDDETKEIIYFRLNEIKAATSNFSDANKLGQGGFGHVYRGELSDGKKIAVKRLSNNSRQGMQEFKTEVKLIIKLQHKNLVRLLGCCMKGNERLLVYEYMPNSSLDKYLFDPKKAKELDWAKRVNIVNGIAKGLRYLHEDSRLKIIHRDLKASNILLDEEMNPKISDFGLARIFGSNQIEANTDRIVGTYGYMAPEYAMEGLFSIKSDVYSFGVLLLEIISGKINRRLFHQEHDQNLLSYVWMLWEEHKAEQLIDENLNDDCPVNEALKWIRIALFCVEADPNDRPTMSSIASMLEGEWKSLSEPKPPMSFGHFITSDQSSTTWNDQSSTT